MKKPAVFPFRINRFFVVFWIISWRNVFHGGDWKIEKIVGAKFVKSCGGKVKRIPFVKGYSTTALIKRIESL